MKIISFLFVGLYVLVGCSGMQPATESDRTFELIVQIPGHKGGDIYDSAKVWIAENFKSAKAVIEYDNKEAGRIIGNGSFKYPCNGLECVAKNDWKVLFTMRVDTKDDKFRLTFSNLKLTWPPSYNSTFGHQKGYEGPVSTKADIEKIKQHLLEYGDRIKAHIEKDATNSNW